MSSKQYFSKVAKNWDKLRPSFFSAAIREKALAAAHVQAGKLAADIGAGRGFITEGLVRKGLRVIAVDRSKAMLAQIRRKYGKNRNIKYRAGTARKIPMRANTVDYVFANMFLHHVDVPPSAIDEMVRILKPGGKLVITDLREHNFASLKTKHHDYWLGFKCDDVRRWLNNTGRKMSWLRALARLVVHGRAQAKTLHASASLSPQARNRPIDFDKILFIIP